MKISTRGRYALRMLLDISLHRSEGYIALKDISARQDISKKYLEQIIPVLNGAGFLKTSRGYQGGYSLAKEPSEIRVGDILRATEGSLNPVACMAAIIASVLPQVTTISLLGSMARPISRDCFFASASRKFCAPQVREY